MRRGGGVEKSFFKECPEDQFGLPIKSTKNFENPPSPFEKILDPPLIVVVILVLRVFLLFLTV